LDVEVFLDERDDDLYLVGGKHFRSGVRVCAFGLDLFRRAGETW
jgi:hypothetical protein